MVGAAGGAKVIDRPVTLARLRREARARLTRAGIATAGLDGDLLLAHAMACTREALLTASREEPVPAAVRARFEELLARRCNRVPLAHLLGVKEFRGREFRVAPAVLVPRPETETLVDEALAQLDEMERPGRMLRLLDLGVGSGAVLLTLLAERAQASGVGTDRSPAAIACARENARRYGLEGRTSWLVGEWDTPLGGQADGSFDLIVSNPPYLPSGVIGSLMPEVAQHEPRLALDGGWRGLDAYPVLARAACRLLRPGGVLVVECGAGQAREVTSIFRRAGLVRPGGRRDLAGIDRVVRACRAR